MGAQQNGGSQIMITQWKRLDSLRLVLRLTYGIVPVVAGLDKFFNLLTTWEQYVSPTVARLLPVSTSTAMHVIGIVEIAAGILVLSRFTTPGAYVVAAWLSVIGLSLIFSERYLDIAVRDIVMAIGAYTLGVLSNALEENRSHVSSYAEERLPVSA
jgi:uncharacterized membrane protein YphA (DoxX/SURF4 family)